VTDSETDNADNTASLLSQRSKEAEAAMPAVEDFFRVVAHRVRARLVNRSSVDIPVRVAGVEVKSLGVVLEDSEYREGSIYSLLRFNPLGMPGMIVLQGALLGRIVGTMLGEDPEEESQMGAVKALTPVEQKIAHRVCGDLVSELHDGWPLSPIPRIETDAPASSPRSVTGNVRNTEVFAATLDFGPPTNPYGLLCCAIPVQAFRALSGPVVIEREKSAPSVDLTSLMPIEVELVAELSAFELTVGQLEQLAVGDTLEVGNVRTASIKVNGKPTFEGAAGEVDGHRSVQIQRRI
jgi:flagellar motor switch protein FliM